MCLAVPSKVISVDDGWAQVEAFGQRRTASLALLEQPPRPGEFLLMRAGGYAVEAVDKERALEALALFAADGLEAAFRRIEHDRMQDIPLLNHALHVEAVGFVPWNGHFLGALITPWFVNLVVVRGSVEGWDTAAEGEEVIERFACGPLAFLCGAEPEVGDFHSCALTTSMHQFASQDTAREFAQAALDALLRPAPAAAPPSSSKRRFLLLGP
jgi:[NiFe] hydrogenase assembly HybE family chaperone